MIFLLYLPLFTAFCLASVALARPFGFGSRIARRSDGLTPRLSNSSVTGELSTSSVSLNWAGVIQSYPSGTFQFVEGMVTVPSASGSDGSGFSVWVGIDGMTCQGAILQTGFDVVMQNGSPTYRAWYEWFPGGAITFSPSLDISTGDLIIMSVVALTATSGTATLKNLRTGQSAYQYITSSSPLCMQDAEWIVEDFPEGGSKAPKLIPLATFTPVKFSDTFAKTWPGSNSNSSLPPGYTAYNGNTTNIEASTQTTVEDDGTVIIAHT